ncbi:MAG TPA: hypothetical protein PLS55_09045 [Thermogutta sp.]|nr:hypothetical protein [Thermogutta sp.]
MLRKLEYLPVLGVLGTIAVFTVGCGTVMSPLDWGVLNYPIPVSPYFQDKLEDKAWEEERYKKMPILPPLVEGAPHIALDEPSDDEVMRALEKARPLEGGLPFLHEVQRSNVRIVKELIADSIDPPRVYPLVGPAQLHHVHWKCTVYFTETTKVGWPIPYTVKNEDAVEVIYIDHDHLHMVGNVDGGPGSNY